MLLAEGFSTFRLLCHGEIFGLVQLVVFVQEIIKSFLFHGVDELGDRTFIDYFPDYECDDGTINKKRSMIGKSFESRPWDSKGEFIGDDLR